MKKIILLLAFLLIPIVCLAWTIDTARGPQEVNKGDILGQNSHWKGTIEGISDVTFYRWNLSRKVPDTEVFINCQNITLVGCQLQNVLIPENKGFKLVDCATLKKWEDKYKDLPSDMKNIVKNALGSQPKQEDLFEIVIDEDDRMTTSKIIRDEVDVIKRDFGHLPQVAQDKIKAKYINHNLDIVEQRDKTITLRKEQAPGGKRYKVKDCRKYSPGHKFIPR